MVNVKIQTHNLENRITLKEKKLTDAAYLRVVGHFHLSHTFLQFMILNCRLLILFLSEYSGNNNFRIRKISSLWSNSLCNWTWSNSVCTKNYYYENNKMM